MYYMSVFIGKLLKGWDAEASGKCRAIKAGQAMAGPIF
jgi:hypothetical protein